MIINSALKTAVESKCATFDLSINDRLATEIILYKYILSYNKTNADASSSNDFYSLVSTYASSFKSKITDLQNTYLSYNKIINFLNKLNVTSIFDISENNIDIIYSYYNDDTMITKFDTSYFSCAMYNTENISSGANSYLKYLHYNVYVPIIKYYNKMYDIAIENMKIVSSTDIPENIGKSIVFFIDGISASQIYSDIVNNNILIDYYQLNYKYPYIEIINI